MNLRCRQRQAGFTAVELLLVLALAAVVLGGAVVSYGTLVRSQPRTASYVTLPLGASALQNFYGVNATSRNVVVAPNYGTLALAEEVREQFNHDILSATAIFCLPRDAVNTWRPTSIPYNPLTHGELDTPQKFRDHVIAVAGISATLYRDFRNPLNTTATVPSSNASIFLLGYSKVKDQIKVLCLYDIDVIKLTTAGAAQGFHASVKRYTDDPRGTTYPLAYSSGYDVYFPPSDPMATSTTSWAKDGFTPLFVTFERSTRKAILETPDTINRFKLAAERPFYLIWWPDPAARHLGPQPNTLAPTDPRQAYNHMGGRTAFMFTVPMFPAL